MFTKLSLAEIDFSNKVKFRRQTEAKSHSLFSQKSSITRDTGF